MSKFIVLFLVLSFSLFSQRIEIKNINTSNYPNILVEVDAFDAQGNQFRNLSNVDVALSENGTDRTIVSKFCEQNAVRFSLLISLDASASMNLNIVGDAVVNKPNRRYDAILRSVELMVRNLDLGNSEVALFQSLGFSNLIKDFTQNRDSLVLELNRFPDTGTSADINVAFTGKNEFGQQKGIGTLQHAAKAKWKPVVIYLSDGGQTGTVQNPQPPVLSEIDEVRIRDMALAEGALVYNINFGNYNNADLSTISGATGGKVYEKNEVSDESGIQNVLADIINEVSQNPQALAPCEIEFISDCSGGGTIEVTATINGQVVTASTTYNLPDEIKPDLLIDNRSPEFLNTGAGGFKETTVNITAQDNDINITGYTATDNRFSVQGAYTGVITKGTSKPITVIYTSDGTEECIEGEITFVSDACTGNVFTPKAGWLNAMNVNVGSAQLGQSVTAQKVAFENKTCNPVTINSLSIVDGAFTHDAVFPLVIPAGGTADINFTYTPTQTGNVSSQYTVTLSDGSSYNGTINGGGSGQAIIATTAPNQPTVKCSDSGVITFDIENSGEIPMNVSSLTLDNTNDFNISTATPIVIASGDKTTISVNFTPQSEGTKNANVTITSDAGNEPSKVVAISGVRSNISAQANTLDIGIICPNSDYEFDLPITNNGEVATDVILSTTSSEITFPNGSSISLANVGSSTNARVRINSGTIGIFDADIIVEDECGDQQTVAKVTGEVREASVDYVDINSISISSNVNETTTETIEIVNNDTRAISNLQITIQNNSGDFTIVPGYPTTIAGNGTINIDIEYAPTAPGSSNLELLITGDIDGNACLSSLLDPVTASTNLAEATWNTSDYEGLIGQIITLDKVSLVDDNGFATSGVSEINFEITVDSRLLESADGLTDAIVDFDRTIQYNYNVANPQPIRLRVLDPNDVSVNYSDIIIESASTVPVGRATINRNDGSFNLIRASGEVGISDNSGKTGDAVTIVISGQNLINVDPNFHQKINGELKVNASILAPRGNTPSGRISTELGTTYRYVPFELNLVPSSPKAPSIQAEADNAELQFFVTLGDAESTEMQLVNLSSEVGVIDVDDINIGTFLVTNVCKNDQGEILLLWRSNPSAPISIQGQNPINSSTMFEVNALETGNYLITISDTNGNIIKNIYQGELVKGNHNFILDPNSLSQGSYFINVVSPSERFDKNFIYIK